MSVTVAGSPSSKFTKDKEYDVFISFRGQDTRFSFTSHLYNAFRINNRIAFIDNGMNYRGEDIPDTLIQAIQNSTVSVVILSKNYAHSRCCLNELLQILHCRKYKGQTVIPFFYKVDPSDVRKQQGSYKEAFEHHERVFFHNPDKVKKWRDALFKTANLAGWDSQIYRVESELIQNMIHDVNQILEPYPATEFDELVGVDEKRECIELLLKKAPIIGIWGMGGIGKTTLARNVYNKIYSQYDSCCFLESLREESEEFGLEYIRDKLISDLLKGERTKPEDVKRRLSEKKVLIVLDDVNSSLQLEYMDQELFFLGPHSRVIITTRNRDLLVGRFNEIYEVKALNYQASLKLFNFKAFNKEHSNKGYEELSKRVVELAQGLPLALVSYGLFLRSRTRQQWESEIKSELWFSSLILRRLKVSFDGLDNEEKEMFLDIACFFKGETEEHVITLLDSFGFNAIIGIRTLVDRAFITIENNIMRMPDLIQKMGWEIIYEESDGELGRCSRLWNPNDVSDVLINETGTDAVKGIILDVSQVAEIYLMPTTFEKMPNLRFLKFYYTSSNKRSNVKLPFGLGSLPHNLSYFQWDGYPLMSLPSMFCVEKLVELHMKGSHVKFLWNGVQDLFNLRKVYLIESKLLIELPDFSRAPKLEIVDLSYCESLHSVHPSIFYLPMLASLNLEGCKELRSLQCEIHLKSLPELNAANFFKLEDFALSSQNVVLPSLTSMNLRGCKNLTILPEFGRIPNLKRLDLEGCTGLLRLPQSVSICTELEFLNLRNCTSLVSIPNSLFGFPRLEFLNLAGCSKLAQFLDFDNWRSSLVFHYYGKN